MLGRKRRKALALLLAVAVPLAAIGQTVAVEPTTNDTVMTGHTNWLDASTTYDSCFAGVAGLLMHRVTWFDGQSLFEQAASGNQTYIYITEHFEDGNDDGYDDTTGIKIDDPSTETLVRTDNTYEFPDPEHPDTKTWVVKEYFATRNTEDLDVEDPAGNEHSSDAGTEVKKVYVYVVQIDPDPLKSETLQTKYNFVNLANTCKFHSEGDREEHDNSGTYGTEPSGQHEEDENDPDGTHNHSAYRIDIWTGGKPDTPPGNDEQGVPDGGPEAEGDDGGSSS